MIVHVFQTHARDMWCLSLHLSKYLAICDRIVVAVDSDPQLTRSLNMVNRRITAIDFTSEGLPESRVDEFGTFYSERAIRQASLDVAMTLDPTWLVFGDTDEYPTPDAAKWLDGVKDRPQAGERYYVHWVNLWGDYKHAIGGDSAWSFQCDRGNKKCFAMQPGGDMRYQGTRHTGMEPGRDGGGRAPTGPGRFLIDSPKLIHLKYGAENYRDRPESRIARHRPAEMLRNGTVIEVPSEWLPDAA